MLIKEDYSTQRVNIDFFVINKERNASPLQCIPA